MALRQHFNKSILGAVFGLAASAHAQTPPAVTPAVAPAAATSDQQGSAAGRPVSAAPMTPNVNGDAPTGVIPGSEAPPNASAREMELYQLYAEASKLHDAEQFDQAYERYQRIWKEKQSYDVAASMGDIDLRREHYAVAATHFQFALGHMPVTQNKLYLATLQSGFDKARPHVAEIHVTAHPAVTDLQISNGVTGERYDQPFFVEPGNHTLKLSAAGYQVVLQEVTAIEAATVDLDVYLTPVGENLEPAIGRTTKRRHPEIVFPVGGLLTLGLGAAATWSFIDANAKHDDLQQLAIGSSECRDSGSARCRRADDLADTTENREILGWGLAGGAVVAAGATVLVWYLWETDVPVDVAYRGDNGELSVRWNHAF
jgi:hypothetical protein